jgi:hypothetical protein
LRAIEDLADRAAAARRHADELLDPHLADTDPETTRTALEAAEIGAG